MARVAVVVIEAVVPHPHQPAIRPVVDTPSERRGAHGEELRAVIERGVTDPAGRHSAADRPTLVDHRDVECAAGLVVQRPRRHESRHPGADDDDAHQPPAAVTTDKCIGCGSATTRCW